METVIGEPTPNFGVEGRHTGRGDGAAGVGRLVVGVGRGSSVWQAARDRFGATRVVIDLRG